MIPSRLKRVEEMIKKEVALIIQQEVKDPRISFLTVTSVKVSKDLRNADIYFAIHEETEERIQDSLKALKSAGGFIRRLLGQRIVLRYLPTLKFHYDNSLKIAGRIDSLLHQIHSGDNA